MRPPSRRPRSSALPEACPPTKTRKLAQVPGWTRRRSEWSKWVTSRSRCRRIRGRCRVNWRTNLERMKRRMKENSSLCYYSLLEERYLMGRCLMDCVRSSLWCVSFFKFISLLFSLRRWIWRSFQKYLIWIDRSNWIEQFDRFSKCLIKFSKGNSVKLYDIYNNL